MRSLHFLLLLVTFVAFSMAAPPCHWKICVQRLYAGGSMYDCPHECRAYLYSHFLQNYDPRYEDSYGSYLDRAYPEY
ncbi:hypothetical protein QR680_004323 [Steinernema hermaphroditum]|uniref:Secreted protein n=1 Tax=Steinernema hermaphroditum TaxID=289476 RepID=A0AA39LTH2_9BILA|nr:hypothetical protein QR680_004323 [Steinernema hermaphroditum]